MKLNFILALALILLLSPVLTHAKRVDYNVYACAFKKAEDEKGFKLKKYLLMGQHRFQEAVGKVPLERGIQVLWIHNRSR